MRNVNTAWTRGHEQISAKAGKVVGLSATPLFNKPMDIVGISVACDLPARFKDTRSWFLDASRTRVNTDTLRVFRETFVDRATDELLNLPPIVDEYRSFAANVDHESLLEYNDQLSQARRLRFSIERNGKASGQEVQRLIQILQKLQQLLVAPLVAHVGAEQFQKDPKMLADAAAAGSGALSALRDTISELNAVGSKRVLVCACHTSLLRVAEAYLKASGSVGRVLLFEGSLSTSKRAAVVDDFLSGSHTVMLMSIDAGGTGLHLVPGSNAVVFWGSRPFSPMQVLQSKKRVHRIGQTEPVKVIHLIAHGSVDYALQQVHGDKLALASAVLDGELDSLEAVGGRWKTTGRIVDACRFLDAKGCFMDDSLVEHNSGFALNVTPRPMVQTQLPCFAPAVPAALQMPRVPAGPVFATPIIRPMINPMLERDPLFQKRKIDALAQLRVLAGRGYAGVAVQPCTVAPPLFYKGKL